MGLFLTQRGKGAEKQSSVLRGLRDGGSCYIARQCNGVFSIASVKSAADFPEPP